MKIPLVHILVLKSFLSSSGEAIRKEFLLETQTSLSSEGIPIFCYLLVDQSLFVEFLAFKDRQNKIEFGINE
jgi:hypothetical protein